VVRFVDDDEVPPGFDDRLETSVVVLCHAFDRPSGTPPDRLHGIERADDLVEGAPRVDACVERDATGTDEHELLVEAVGHLRHPLEPDSFGRHDQDSLHEPAGFELGNHEPGLHRLAESDLVGQQQPQWIAGHGPIEDGELVGERIHAAPGDRERFPARHGAPRQPGGRPPDNLVRQPRPIREWTERRGCYPLEPSG
jgi:hypothetical protein